MGVQNAYFPMFIPEHLLRTEEEHIQGFEPELAWVTKRESQNSNNPLLFVLLQKLLCTYPYYQKWIWSHRDLPLKLNQWNSGSRPISFSFQAKGCQWCDGNSVILNLSSEHERYFGKKDASPTSVKKK